MKKIFILPILIAPIMAHATDPVGPAHVNSGAVVATANAPYAIATPETGDTTNVVSASYVKGAYNDAIAAINNVSRATTLKSEELEGRIYDIEEEKQDKFVSETGNDLAVDVIGGSFEDTIRHYYLAGDNPGEEMFDQLTTAGGAFAGITTALNVNGVSAVTAWGDDNNATVLDFVPKN